MFQQVPNYLLGMAIITIVAFKGLFLKHTKPECMIRLSILLLCLMASAQVFSQGLQYKKSEVLTTAAPVQVNMSRLQAWQPSLQKIEAPAPGGNSYRDFLQELKKDIHRTGANKQQGSTAQLGDADLPIYNQGFVGNSVGGSPNDNDVAISNAGKLISVINSKILVYDTQADTAMLEVGLLDFTTPLGITPHMYDPKVAYDPVEDKFVMVWLSGSEVDSSSIIVAFSESADPLGNWNLYSLPGDTLDGQTWTDYPMIALTSGELIITGNALIDDTINTSDSWKFLFKESIIWQIDKADGYAGSPLSLRLYTGVYFNNQPLRNLCPVKGGPGLFGPEVYLLSNRNFALTNDSIFVLKITGLHNNPATQLQVEVNFTDIPYGLAPDATQPNNWTLQTNDSRVLGAYLADGQIHYVQNTVLPDSARCGIYHGKFSIDDNSNLIEGHIIGRHDMDFGYPNISYTGKYPNDDEAMISFNHCSADTFPGVSAVFFNGRTGYSDRLTLKEGVTFATRLGSVNPRWGDYSGSQTKYDEPGTVWISGFWGERLPSGIDRNVNATWVAKLVSPDTTDFSSIAPGADRQGIKTYPNPTADVFVTTFKLAATEKLEIGLYDMNGRHVKTFLRETLSAGEHQFSFSMQPLEKGMYFLTVQAAGEVRHTQRVVKQ